MTLRNLTSKFIVVLAVFTLSLECNAETLARKNIFQLVPTLNDVVFQSNVLFDVIVRSQLDCLTSCSLRNGCFFVTLYDDMRCRGHNVSQSNPAVGTPNSGARTYIADGWLNQPCSQDTDCANTITNDVLCFGGLCLCVPGYYYSLSTRQCVQGCAASAIKKPFMRYPGHIIVNNNLDNDTIALVAHCQVACIMKSSFLCRSVEYNAATKSCTMATVTVLDVPASSWVTDPTTDYFQRNCA